MKRILCLLLTALTACGSRAPRTATPIPPAVPVVTTERDSTLAGEILTQLKQTHSGDAG